MSELILEIKTLISKIKPHVEKVIKYPGQLGERLRPGHQSVTGISNKDRYLQAKQLHQAKVDEYRPHDMNRTLSRHQHAELNRLEKNREDAHKLYLKEKAGHYALGVGALGLPAAGLAYSLTKSDSSTPTETAVKTGILGAGAVGAGIGAAHIYSKNKKKQ